MSKSDTVGLLVVIIGVVVIISVFILAGEQGKKDTLARELRLFTRGAEAGCIAVLHLRGELDGIADCAEAVRRVQAAYPDTDLLKILGGAE